MLANRDENILHNWMFTLWILCKEYIRNCNFVNPVSHTYHCLRQSVPWSLLLLVTLSVQAIGSCNGDVR